MSWFDGIDPVAATRGASTGFSVLVIGGLAAPIVASTVPVVGTAALVVTAVVAFAIAGSRLGEAPSPVRQGITAALGAYLLVLPLTYFATRHVDPVQLGCTAGLAVLVGAAAGMLTARRQGRAVTATRPAAPPTAATRPARSASTRSASTRSAATRSTRTVATRSAARPVAKARVRSGATR